MSSSVTPVQTRYNDPYEVQIYDFMTADSKVYLTEESNRVLRAIGNNIVLSGLTISSVTFLNSVITININGGYAIQDDVLVIVTDVSSTLTIDVSLLGDTPHYGCHLAVFVDYGYIPTAETNTLALKVFHIEADSTESSVTFNAARDKLLLGVIEFEKSGVNVISASELFVGNLTVETILFWVRGYDPSNLNFQGIVDFAITLSTGLQDLRELFLRMDYLLSE